MKCQECDQPAILHTSIVVGEATQEIHLCRVCAEKRKLLDPDSAPNLPMIVKQSVGKVGFLTTDLTRLQCPDCGIKYMDFRKAGRLGCPYDYVLFREGILPLLDRVHRATHHTGKRPKFASPTTDEGGELRRLRRQLRVAVEAQDFEEAARLRDLIRAKEPRNGSG